MPVYAKFWMGIAPRRVAIDKSLQRYSQRTNCWIDFNDDGFRAGHAQRVLVTRYWFSDVLQFARPKNAAQSEASQALAKALGVTVDWNAVALEDHVRVAVPDGALVLEADVDLN